MSENFENINPWAEKLQEASIPDFSASWQAMETLLDQKMPVKKSNGLKRWALVILSILLLIGVCNCPAIRHTIPSSQNKVKVVLQTSPGITKTVSSLLKDKLDPIAGNKSNKIEPGISVSTNASHSKYKNNLVGPHSVNYLKPFNRISNKENSFKTNGETTNVNKVSSNKLAEYFSEKKGISRLAFRKSAKLIKHGKGNTAVLLALGIEEDRRRNNNPDITLNEIVQNENKTGPLEKQKEVMKNSEVTLVINSVSVSSNVNNKDSLRNSMPSNDSVQNRKKDSTVTGNKKNKKIAWAAGLGMNQFLAVGSQQQSDYNSAGNRGVLSNYVPVTMLRAYVNRKFYFNLEVQFNTPQYTKLLLVKQVTSSVTPTVNQPPATIQSSVFIKELYYFNIPLSIHYSLFRNFFIGSGVQFSHLTSAVGLFKNQRFSLINSFIVSQSSSNTASLKSNAVYNEIKPNEFRLLFDASYQWKDITFGVSYNQSLRDFINIHLSATQITEARNRSLQLYFRFIILKNKNSFFYFSHKTLK